MTVANCNEMKISLITFSMMSFVFMISSQFLPDPVVPYILEAIPHPNIIRTRFADFLKKKVVRSSNPHLWEDDGEDKDDSDWVTDSDSVMSDDGECDE